MISVICTQCRAQLEMDDAFAGGVCRCQYCGTIQTVPSLSKIKRQSAPTAAPALTPAAAPASPHPQANDSPTGPTSGLDALAEAVASSSGLGRGSLRSGASGPPAGPQGEYTDSAGAGAGAAAPPVDYARPSQQKRPVSMVVIGAVIGASLLVALGGVFYSTRRTVSTGPAGGSGVPVPGPGGSGGNPVVPAPGDGGDGERVVIPTTAHFCGIDLKEEPSVVYVLDRGTATADMFDTMKEAMYRSLESLKPHQKFAVMFWSNGGEDACYPEGAMAPARPTEIEAARARFADVYAGSRADPHEAIQNAAALKPGAIVIVTGKAFDLDEDLVDLVRQSLAGTRTKVHTIALGSDDGSTVLKRISEATGGQSRVVTKPELRAFSD
jgi:hypothetical protein